MKTNMHIPITTKWLGLKDHLFCCRLPLSFMELMLLLLTGKPRAGFIAVDMIAFCCCVMSNQIDSPNQITLLLTIRDLDDHGRQREQ